MRHGLAIVVVGGLNPPSVQGLLAAPPATAPPASRATAGTASGWVACLVLVIFFLTTNSVIFFLNKIAPGTSIPVAVRPASGTDGSRISSSYSPSGVRTGVFRAAAGCTAAAVGGQNLTPRAAYFENATV